MKIKKDDKKWEDDIRNLLINMGFEQMMAWSTSPMGFQVDASGGCDNKFLLIDATISENPSYKYNNMKEFNARKRKIISAIRQDKNRDKYDEFVYVIWIDTKSTSRKISAEARKHGIYILTRNEYDLFKRRINTIDKMGIPGNVQKGILRYWLFKILQLGLPKMEGIDYNNIPAIKFLYKKNIYAYCFVLSPSVLLRASYVWRREITGEEGYQRLLNENRINDIREFIEDQSATFPNNIIINYADKGIQLVKEKPTRNLGISSCVIKIPDEYCSAQIIDGQHRLYGFMDIEDEGINKKLAMNVIAFDGLSKRECAKIFVDLNEEQKRIDPSLYWDLVGDYFTNTEEGQISMIVKQLNEKGVFYGRVWIPGKGYADEDKATINLASICEGLSNRHIMHVCADKSDQEQYQWDYYYRAKKRRQKARALAVREINRYFGIMYDMLPSKWKEFIYTNNGINIMLHLFVEALRSNRKNGRHMPLNDNYIKKTVKPLAKYLSRKTIDEKERYIKEASSEAMRGEFADEFIRIINKRKGMGYYAREYLLDKEIKVLRKELNAYSKRTEKVKNMYKRIVSAFLQKDDTERARVWAKHMRKEYPKSKFAKQHSAIN